MKSRFLSVSFGVLLCRYWSETTAQLADPDLLRNVSEIITSKGYPIEEHTVQTDDGYLLSLLRIPHGRNGDTGKGDKKVVLLIHGEIEDANAWVLNFPGQSLGFILPDEGYDVWLISGRGSDYSKKHIEYHTHEYRFWNFSIDDLAKYDMPNTIDYILSATGKESLYVIGYSRGNTLGFAMLSDMAEYNEKVKLLVALGPIAWIGHFKTDVRVFIPIAEPIAFAVNLVTGGEFIPDNIYSKALLGLFCELGPDLCENVLFAIGGVDRTQLNETRLEIYTSKFPSSTSTKIMLHYAQLYRSKKFRKYDYGRHLNMKYYNQEEPPDYNVSRITTPIALFRSSNDIIADPEDVAILRGLLKSLVKDHLSPYPYNHFDWVLAKNAPELVYKPILQLLAEY